MKRQRGITVKQCADTGLVMALVAISGNIISDLESWLYLSAGLIISALMIPRIFYPFAVIWFGFSRMLGSVTSRVILYLVFFTVVTPVGIVRRIAGKDRLQLKDFKKSRSSAFTVRNHLYCKEDLIHPF